MMPTAATIAIKETNAIRNSFINDNRFGVSNGL
jgi:hypothetical protein